MFRRRPLMRAAVIGGGAYYAGKKVQQSRAHSADQDAQIADAIPEGMSAGVAVLEHRWAIPLRDAITASGGAALADEWLHPQDLIALGIEAAQ